MVEIAFIQRFVLFLGHPTYALTVVVFLLLLASGAGSLASRRWLDANGRTRFPLALIVLATLSYVFLLPRTLNALVGLPFVVKLLISGALLIQLVRYTLLANGVPDAAALVVKGAIIAGAVWSQQRGRSA